MSRILIFGPGMIGTHFAAKLAEAGHDVAVYGRGARLAAIEAHGVVVRAPNGPPRAVRVATLSKPGTDSFDWVLATVRGDQVESALPTLSALKSPHLMVLANDAGDLTRWATALGSERLAIGFPGASGTFDADGVLRYRIAPALFQPTTIGELDGSRSARLSDLAALFREAGIPSAISTDIRAWMRTHVAWISVFALVSAAAGYDADRLASDAELRQLAARAVRESLRLVRDSGVRLTPAPIAALAAAPVGLVSSTLGALAPREVLRPVLENSGPGRRTEMQHMAAQVIAIADAEGAPLSSYRRLIALAAGEAPAREA